MKLWLGLMLKRYILAYQLIDHCWLYSWCEKTTLSIIQFVELLELCLRSTYFTFRERFYKLTDGVAMGSPVSSVMANILIERLEEVALRSAIAFQPRV